MISMQTCAHPNTRNNAHTNCCDLANASTSGHDLTEWCRQECTQEALTCMRAMLSALIKPKDLPVSGGYSRRPMELALQQHPVLVRAQQQQQQQYHLQLRQAAINISTASLKQRRGYNRLWM